MVKPYPCNPSCHQTYNVFPFRFTYSNLRLPQRQGTGDCCLDRRQRYGVPIWRREVSCDRKWRKEKWLGGFPALRQSHLHTYLNILQHCLLSVAAFPPKWPLITIWWCLHELRLMIWCSNVQWSQSSDRAAQLHHRPAVICHDRSRDL